jgi:hypothetical protein
MSSKRGKLAPEQVQVQVRTTIHCGVNFEREERRPPVVPGRGDDDVNLLDPPVREPHPLKQDLHDVSAHLQPTPPDRLEHVVVDGGVWCPARIRCSAGGSTCGRRRVSAEYA